MNDNVIDRVVDLEEGRNAILHMIKGLGSQVDDLMAYIEILHELEEILFRIIERREDSRS